MAIRIKCQSKGKDIIVQVWPQGSHSEHEEAFLTLSSRDAVLPLEGFVELVWYGMTDMNLTGPDDPRLELLSRLKKLHQIDGFPIKKDGERINPEEKRLGLEKQK